LPAGEVSTSHTSAPPDAPPAEWLSIGPASRLLGVDPDTLRRWADEGRVDVFATPGGHRRFARKSLEQLVATRRVRSPALAALGATPDRVSRAYRRRYAAARSPEHRIPGAVAADDREAFRDGGRRLVAALLRHLDSTDEKSRAATEAEAGAIVDDLAARLVGAGTGLTEAVALFVAARRPFLSELGATGRRRALAPVRLARLYDDASAVLDRLLLRFVGAYQRRGG
jgi:excisionase family DNA binding protein